MSPDDDLQEHEGLDNAILAPNVGVIVFFLVFVTVGVVGAAVYLATKFRPEVYSAKKEKSSFSPKSTTDQKMASYTDIPGNNILDKISKANCSCFAGQEEIYQWRSLN